MHSHTEELTRRCLENPQTRQPTSRQDNSFTDGLGAGFNSKEETHRADLTGPCTEWLRRDRLRPGTAPVDHWRLEEAGVDQWIHIWTLWFITGFPGQLLSIGSVISIQSEPGWLPQNHATPWQQGLNLQQDNEPQTFIKALPELEAKSRQHIAAFSIQHWARSTGQNQKGKRKELRYLSCSSSCCFDSIVDLDWELWPSRVMGQ